MSVTADQIEAVAEHAEAVHLVGAAQQLRGRAAHVRLVEAQPAEVVELAAAIRNAYYNDGVRRELLSSRDPGQWLRMAVEAKSALGESLGDLAAMIPGVPRVFNVGDREPADRDTITLRGTSNGGFNSNRPLGAVVSLKFGNHAIDPESYDGPLTWWQVAESNRTHCTWNHWLEHYGPLTEVLDEPKPRTFKPGDPEPEDITYARDEDGDLFKRKSEDYWLFSSDGRCFDSSTRFYWSEVVQGKGAIEVLGDLG
ncbi:UNVERIFIED_ORG: hypothetical protein M2328_005729 [Rhodococcus erythropolis]